MKNFEKLKELKDYQLAHVMQLVNIHVQAIQFDSEAFDNFDAFDLVEDQVGITASWLNSEYDEKKGFAVLINGKIEYFNSEDLERFSYLEGYQQDLPSHEEFED